MAIFLINLLLVKERLKVYPHWSLQFEAFLSFHWADHQTIRLINLYFDGLAMLLYYFWMTLNESFKQWIPMTSMPDDSDVSVLPVTSVWHTKYKSPNSRIYLFPSNGGKTKNLPKMKPLFECHIWLPYVWFWKLCKKSSHNLRDEINLDFEKAS